MYLIKKRYNIIMFLLFILLFYLILCDFKRNNEIKYLENNKDYFENDSLNNNSIIQNIKNVSDFIDKTKVDNYNFVDEKNKINIHGDLNVEIFSQLPTGCIMMWTKTEIPQGWVLCDGKSHKIKDQTIMTPDLRGRFVFHRTDTQDWDNFSKYNLLNANYHYYTRIHSMDGSEKVALTEDDLPEHYHDHNIYKSERDDHFGGRYIFDNGTKNDHSFKSSIKLYGLIGKKSDGSDYKIENSKNGDPHENMHPFYVLTYIMRL